MADFGKCILIKTEKKIYILANAKLVSEIGSLNKLLTQTCWLISIFAIV